MGWTVYSVTHRDSGKQYIGVTCRPASRRWAQHRCDARKGKGWLLARAIREHGEEAFDFTVLVSNLNEAAGKETECRLIALLKPEFNVTPGGDAMPVMTPERRAAKSASMMGKSIRPIGHEVTVETRARISAALTGRPLSAQHRAKLSLSQRVAQSKPARRAQKTAAMRGNKYRLGHKASPETRAKMSAAHKARATPEARARMSEAIKAVWAARKAMPCP